MTTQSLNIAWNGFRIVLRKAFSFNDIKEIVASAGVDVTTAALSELVQRPGDGASKGELMAALDGRIGDLGDKDKERVLVRIAEVMVQRSPLVDPPVVDQVNEHLKPLGWSYTGGALIPIEVLDIWELKEVPDAARTDLVKAAVRFQDGDLSGALGSACAAVDSAAKAIYERYGLGNPARDSFQGRCSKALESKGTVTALIRELTDLGWQEEDAMIVGKNVKGSLNQGASVMQKLRSGMGDAHGTKRALRTVVFDSLKWASLIVAALK